MRNPYHTQKEFAEISENLARYRSENNGTFKLVARIVKIFYYITRYDLIIT